MKKFLTIFMIFGLFMVAGLKAFADGSQDALKFFNSYVVAANSYNPAVISMYSPTAKIIRQVIKPNGELVNVYTDTPTYIKQMKLGQAGAKIRHYKNTYTNITVAPSNGAYKVSALRQPSGETYKLKTYMIVKEQSNGKWLIIEEMMQTKEQMLLRYAKQQ